MAAGIVLHDEDVQYRAVLAYLHKVLWKWAGILVSIDAIVALLERYFGYFIEHRLDWNWRVAMLDSRRDREAKFVGRDRRGVVVFQ
jgi:hypothetical protein